MSVSALPNALSPQYQELKQEVETSTSEICSGFRKNQRMIHDLTAEIHKIKNRSAKDKFLIGMAGVAFVIIGLALIKLLFVQFEGAVLRALFLDTSPASAVAWLLSVSGFLSASSGLWYICDAFSKGELEEAELICLKITKEKIQNLDLPRLVTRLQQVIRKISIEIATLEDNNNYYTAQSQLKPRLSAPLDSHKNANLQEIENLNAIKTTASSFLDEIILPVHAVRA